MTTEVDVFECLEANFARAAEDCLWLAILPARGPTYTRLREELKIIEGACRQVAHWRGDTRWLTIGLQMEFAHQRAGYWLRYQHPRPLFAKLGQNLRDGAVAARRLRNGATGRRSGPILPDVLRAS
ncbi:MAG: hypothetical protein ABI196_21595 [Bradyrhizobium sp.]